MQTIPTPIATSFEPPVARCCESQADGVPCAEIRDCEQCGRALPLELERTRAVSWEDTALSTPWAV